MEKKSNLWRIQDILFSVVLYEACLTNFDQIDNLVALIKPDIIFHLAAYGIFPDQQNQKKILVFITAFCYTAQVYF